MFYRKLWLICCLSLSILAASEPKNNILNIKQWQESNSNIPVWFVQRDANPILDIIVVYKAGSAFDNKFPGLAKITNQTINKATKKLNFKKLHQQLASIGAITNNFIDQDKAILSVRTLTTKDKTFKTLDLFTEIISKPRFANKDINLIKKNETANLLSKNNQPMYIASKTLLTKLYPNHPYGKYSSKQSINKINKKLIINFFKKYYVRENAKIILVGDISSRQAKLIASKIAASMPTGKKAPSIKQPMKQKSQTINVNFNSQQSAILFGQIGIKQSQPNRAILNLANHILGIGMNSILFDEIRNKRGWCYYIFSTFKAYSQNGPFLIGTKTQQTNLSKVINTINKYTNEYATKGPSQQQLDIAKKQIISEIYGSLSSNKKLLPLIINMAFYDKNITYLDNYIKTINNANRETVKQIFSDNLQPLIIVTVGPNAKKK